MVEVPPAPRPLPSLLPARPRGLFIDCCGSASSPEGWAGGGRWLEAARRAGWGAQGRVQQFCRPPVGGIGVPGDPPATLTALRRGSPQPALPRERGLHRPEESEGALVLNRQQEWRERPPPSRGRAARLGWRGCCEEGEPAAQARGECNTQPGPACGLSPICSAEAVKAAQIIWGELLKWAGCRASLLSQTLLLNSSKIHCVCLTGYLTACKTIQLHKSGPCQPQMRPFLPVWSNSGLTLSSQFSFVQGALH